LRTNFLKKKLGCLGFFLTLYKRAAEAKKKERKWESHCKEKK
jgi:hypothetical protein